MDSDDPLRRYHLSKSQKEVKEQPDGYLGEEGFRQREQQVQRCRGTNVSGKRLENSKETVAGCAMRQTETRTQTVWDRGTDAAFYSG